MKVIIFGLTGVIISLVLSLLFSIFVWGGEGELKENFPQGQINWTTGIIRAYGDGAPSPEAPNPAVARLGAKRAATADARRNLLEIIKGVRVESVSTMDTLFARSDVIRTAVSGFIQGSRVIDTQYLSDGTVRVTVEISMRDEFSQVVLDEVAFGGGISFFEKIKGIFFQALGYIASGIRSALAIVQPVEKATGLILDVRELPVKPALFPRIFDQNGELVFGPENMDREMALTEGAIGYATTLEKARADTKRLGVAPKVVKGLIPIGPGGVDVKFKDLSRVELKEVIADPKMIAKCGITLVYKMTF